MHTQMAPILSSSMTFSFPKLAVSVLVCASVHILCFQLSVFSFPIHPMGFTRMYTIGKRDQSHTGFPHVAL